MVTIRKATAQDARVIRELIRRVGINPMGLSWPRFLVAVDAQDQVIGCGQVKPHRDGTHELASIAVQPEWQSQGIGKALVKQLLNEYSPPLYLFCQAKLERYYQQFGFHSIRYEEMPPYFRQIYRLYRIFRRIYPRAAPLIVLQKAA